MGIFDFMSEGVEEAINNVQQQIQRAEDMMADLRNVVAPLENGGWIGEGADSFFDDHQRMQADLQQMVQHLTQFQQALTQAMQMITETQQQIISNIGS